MNNAYCWSFIVFIVSVVLLCCAMLFFGYFLGIRSNSCNRNVSFESGIASVGNARIRFSVKFYRIAMLFVIFDVEGIYIYIWSISVQEIGWTGLSIMTIFVFVLLASLIYSVCVGVFHETRKVLVNQ